ncbi:uncharacterized protein LOC114531979 [Dendronephthya gigantea]|uniref:uncharacterized protein LOC114531979 n=1 Tax=Dendronephthya gigantea TaxID=151771 RepID=UPI00106AD638|nr:uncharacterized protein LOC114531979 [Dendronephthya gigantea]
MATHFLLCLFFSSGMLANIKATIQKDWESKYQVEQSWEDQNFRALSKQFFKTSTKWYNELGSEMIITSLDRNNGSFEGTYNSGVGQAEKEYYLVGRFDTNGSTIGWVVSWQNKFLISHSTTAWSGQMQFQNPEKPVILTTWLLTRQTEPKDDWESTIVGFDTFTQDPPSQETIERAKLRRRVQPSTK